MKRSISQHCGPQNLHWNIRAVWAQCSPLLRAIRFPRWQVDSGCSSSSSFHLEAKCGGAIVENLQPRLVSAEERRVLLPHRTERAHPVCQACVCGALSTAFALIGTLPPPPSLRKKGKQSLHSSSTLKQHTGTPPTCSTPLITRPN
ncbi:hypothetical protein MHYP_G00110100 [Metynnis hypsauchen]